MKYRKIYEALERRWRVSPGFRFTDYSGWHTPRSGRNKPRCDLWIVAEDKLSGHCVWIAQISGQLSIMYKKMDEKGLCYGPTRSISCKNQAHMAQEIDALFGRLHKAA